MKYNVLLASIVMVMELMCESLILNLKLFKSKICLFVSRKDFIVVSMKYLNGHRSGTNVLLVASSAWEN